MKKNKTLALATLLSIGAASGGSIAADLEDMDMATMKQRQNTTTPNTLSSHKFERKTDNKKLIIAKEQSSDVAQIDPSKKSEMMSGADSSQALSMIASEFLSRQFPGVKPKQLGQVTGSGSEVYIAAKSTSKFGAQTVSFKQKIDGVRVFGKSATVLLDKDYNLIAISGDVAQSAPSDAPMYFTRASQSAAEAVEQAFSDLGLQVEALVVEDDNSAKATGLMAHLKKQKRQDEFNFTINTLQPNYTGIDAQRAVASPVWYEYNGQLVSAYSVSVYGAIQKKEMIENIGYSYVIAKKTSQGAGQERVLNRKNLLAKFDHSYTTFVGTENGDPTTGDFIGPVVNPYPLIDTTPEESAAKYSMTFDPRSIKTVGQPTNLRSENESWHFEDFENSFGTNVFAYSFFDTGAFFGDAFGVIDNHAPVETTDGLAFDHQYDPLNPFSEESRAAATMNAFYITNWLHDYFYDFGFDDAAGTAQVFNSSEEIEGGFDPLIITTHFLSQGPQIFGNPDGTSPWMHLPIFLSQTHLKNESFWLEANIQDEQQRLDGAEFSGVGPFGFTIEDATVIEVALNSQCDLADVSVDVSNKIVMFNEPCDAQSTLNNLSARGAIAGLLGPSVTHPAPTSLSALAATDTLPSFDLSTEGLDEVRNLIAQNIDATFNLHQDPLQPVDSALATPIVIHEWAHYVTDRLIGNSDGLMGSVPRALGEGWSDFLAMYFNIREADKYILGNDQYQGIYSLGTYLRPDSVYWGIRRVPYTTDMRYNAVTFENTVANSPFVFDHPQTTTANPGTLHGVGEFWANTLLEVYVALLNDSSRLSFSEAKERMAHYFIASLKVTPSDPSFTDARDALLAVAYATDMQDYALMQKAFAKRGLGVRAVAHTNRFFGAQGSFEYNIERVVIDKVESFVEIPFDTLSEKAKETPFFRFGNELSAFFVCDKDDIMDEYEFGELEITVRNIGDVSSSPELRVTTRNSGIILANRGRVKLETLAPNGFTGTVKVPYFVLFARQQEELKFDVAFIENNNEADYGPTVSVTDTIQFDLENIPGDRNIDTFDDRFNLVDWELEIGFPREGFNYREEALNSLSLVPFWNSNNMLQLSAIPSFSNVYVRSPIMSVSPQEPFSVIFNASWRYARDNGETPNGAVVEISVDGGEWINVVDAGGSFIEGGYNGQILRQAALLDPSSGEAIPEFPTPAFVGRSLNNFDDDGNLENRHKLSFDDSLAGKSIQLRFYSKTDELNPGSPGIQIDNFEVSGVANSGLSSRVRNDLFCEKNVFPSQRNNSFNW